MMPITITKTLQGDVYNNLYSLPEPLADTGGFVVFDFKVHRTVGHYNDGFTALLVRREIIMDVPTLETYRQFRDAGNMPGALGVIENYVVTQSGFHQGGTVS
jgi:hypothetical protein